MLSFSLGGVTLYAYGLALALSAAVCLCWGSVQARRTGLKAGTLSWFALLALPLGVLCARLAYCLIRWGWFQQKGWSWFFRFHEGGFVLYGALAGAWLAAVLTARLTRQSAARLLDAVAAPAALMIALSRLAEGLADEGYGWDMETWFTDSGMSLFPMEDPYGLFFFPLGHYRADWDTWYWAVYVLEALLAVGICVVVYRSRPVREGDRAALLVLLYAAGQILCESMRQDSVLRWGFVRVSQVLSAIAAAGVLLYWCLRARPGSGRAMLMSWAGTLCCMLLVIAMEFGVEKKIVFLEWMPVSACYLVMALACAGLVACILPMRRRAKEG